MLRPREAGARGQQRAPRSRIPGSALSPAGRQAGGLSGGRGCSARARRWDAAQARCCSRWAGCRQVFRGRWGGLWVGGPPLGSALWGWQVAGRGGGDLGTGAGRRRAVKVRKVAAEEPEEPGRLGGRWVPRSGVVGRGPALALALALGAAGRGRRARLASWSGVPVASTHVGAGKAGSRSRQPESLSGELHDGCETGLGVPKRRACQEWDSNPRLQGRLRPERSALDRSAILTAGRVAGPFPWLGERAQACGFGPSRRLGRGLRCQGARRRSRGARCPGQLRWPGLAGRRCPGLEAARGTRQRPGTRPSRTSPERCGPGRALLPAPQHPSFPYSPAHRVVVILPLLLPPLPPPPLPLGCPGGSLPPLPPCAPPLLFFPLLLLPPLLLLFLTFLLLPGFTWVLRSVGSMLLEATYHSVVPGRGSTCG